MVKTPQEVAWQKKKSRGPLSMQVRGQAVGYQGLRVEGSGRLPSNAWWQWQSAHTYFAPFILQRHSAHYLSHSAYSRLLSPRILLAP